MKCSILTAFLLSATALAIPAPRHVSRSSFSLQNGEQAIAQNNQFASLTADSACTSGQNACVNQEFAQCVNGKFVLTSCGSGLICAALPLVNSAGTSITCTTQSDLQSRIAATGATSGSNSTSSAVSSGVASASASAASASPSVASASVSAVSSAPSVVSAAPSSVASASVVPTASAAPTAAPSESADPCGGPVPPISVVGSTVSAPAPTASATPPSGSSSVDSSSGSGNSTDAQSSLTLDPAVIATGFESDGQEQPAAGQVASLTSSNNFINFCATTNLPLTNGTQIKTGSCNPAPMGIIPSTNNMPSAKFVSPANFGTVPANQNFTVSIAVSNLATGFFTNAEENYFAAPQQVDGSGNIKGHSHIVIEKLTSLNQTTPTQPGTFAFFKGLNDPAQNGVLNATVAGGLPAGAYRMASINTAMNHQPLLVAIAQHGALDDMIYFTVQ